MAEAEAPIGDSRPARERPLSPHLQIYKWPVTMATSIAHRVTGVGNALGMLLLAWWLIALASGPDAYEIVRAAMASFPGRLVLFGFTLSLVFHSLNGVRHLFWDAGHGFGLRTARATGLLVFVLTVLVALAIWALAYAAAGGAP
ncbi:MAG: succinate dehydrogenase, cytochrome b556 subunit [Alphaproteobacteria bacterium]|nr:succinate dehydrogenase, cytochrome b556 subunit [Alphaproteobacteria bacterium]